MSKKRSQKRAEKEDVLNILGIETQEEKDFRITHLENGVDVIQGRIEHLPIVLELYAKD